MSAMTDQALPLRILIHALGGEGGGVLMNWIVSAATAAGRKVQATSVPGVAQRTGSTTYYIEIAPPGTDPVMGLSPMPGRVDVVLASELVEAARAMEAGFVSPRLTTLIASTNRVYATAEKIQMGDGRKDDARVVAAARALARTSHLHDLDALARENGTFISATLYGALLGSGVLPWDRAMSLAVLGQGRGAEASRRGVEAAERAVQGIRAAQPAPSRPEAVPEEPGPVDGLLPPAIRKIASHGRERLLDYQGDAYARLYSDRLARLADAADPADHRALHALGEAARRLALWMAYEDVARVADLKTRAERFARIRAEAEMTEGQVLRVVDYLKPRAEEVADILPVGIGRRIMARVERGKGLPFLGRGIHLHSNGIIGYRLLRFMAGFKRLRPRSLRYAREQADIEAWMAALVATLPTAPGFAGALAELPRLRKGYSDTLARGLRAYERIFQQIVAPAVAGPDPEAASAALRDAMAAAMADDSHGRLDACLADLKGAA